jgi:hypothetical protein
MIVCDKDIGIFLPEYTASHPIRQLCLRSIPWELKISLISHGEASLGNFLPDSTASHSRFTCHKNLKSHIITLYRKSHIGSFLSEHTASHPRRQLCLRSIPWVLKISLISCGEDTLGNFSRLHGVTSHKIRRSNLQSHHCKKLEHHSLRDLTFDPEDRGSMLLRNVHKSYRTITTHPRI